MGGGDRGGSNEVLWVLYGWVGGVEEEGDWVVGWVGNVPGLEEELDASGVGGRRREPGIEIFLCTRDNPMHFFHQAGGESGWVVGFEEEEEGA